MNRFIVSIAGLAMIAGTASAAFLGIQVREDKVLPPVSTGNPRPVLTRTFNIYAKFDGAGTDTGPGRVNTVLSIGQPNNTNTWGINLASNPGANFYQASAPQGASASNVGGPDLGFFNDNALYDSWVSIGQKYTDSSVDPAIGDTTAADNDFAFLNTDSVSGAASLGIGAGHDSIRGGWFNASPPNLQGAAHSNAGKFETFLCQLTIKGLAVGADAGTLLPFNGNATTTWASDIFRGSFIVFRQGDSSIGEPPAVGTTITFVPIPTPGALSMFGVAGLLAARRRR